ncbi:hypothetical protein AB0M02_27055 [Actinoplanes sp. NPDC051861]|uniref:hypothetical protein n=1 Tax=Actinoplanes sp. NPDC051861 TaxID=3155170 RepID=UPI00342EE5F2
MTIRVLPILAENIPGVARFLHQHLNSRLPAQVWADSLAVPWPVRAPNHGFMLVVDALIVGVYLAFYCDRVIAGKTEQFCNLGGWCVLPEYRLQSVRLLKALLAQDGYHFTDLSPSGNVIPINRRFDFQFLDSDLVAVPNLPWPSPRGRITSDPRRLDRLLTGSDHDIYRDHRQTLAAHHVLIESRGESCYVIFRRDRPKNLPLFASLVHVSNPEVFRRRFRPFTSHLLTRHGIPATLVEPRVAGFHPRAALPVHTARRRMFRSDTLQPHQIDYLYSELVCVPF